VPPHIPTSVVLTQLIEEAPHDGVSLAWLMGRLQERSFGILMLVLALLGLAPGIATLTGFLLAFPAIQMIMGRESPTFPHIIAVRSIPTRHFVRWSAHAIPLLKSIETVIRPRLQMPFQTTKRLVGLVVLILAATLIWPLPFSHVVPTLVVMMISFAYVERDGVLLCLSLAAALLSLSATAAMIWATVQATDLIEGLWTGL
jgi:hypothetical protein